MAMHFNTEMNERDSDLAVISHGAAELRTFAASKRTGLATCPTVGARVRWGVVFCDVQRVADGCLYLSSRTKSGWVEWTDPTLVLVERHPWYACCVGRL